MLNGDALPSALAPEPLAAAIMQAALSIPAPSAVSTTHDLAATLHSCEPATLTGAARLAFWLNIYNALVRSAFHHLQLRGSVVRNLGVFNRAAWVIGGARFSLNMIEHGLLRGNARVPPLKLFRTLRTNDARLAAATGSLERRIHFALNCGARSCPPLQVYREISLEEQLDSASRAYFAEHAGLDQAARRVRLPRLMKYFQGDFGARADALRFAAQYFDPADGTWLLQHIDQVKIDYAPYDWSIVTSGI